MSKRQIEPRSIPPRDVMEHMATLNPVFQNFGMEVLDAVPGRSRFAMAVKPDMANTFGFCHGGIYFVLADTCFGWTCNASNQKSVTAGATIELLASAKVGDRLICEAIETARAGRNAFYAVKIWVEGGETVALVQGRMRLVGGAIMPET